MNKAPLLVAACLLGASLFAEVSPAKTLWKAGDNGIKSYRIPAICTAPNGNLIAACDARTYHGGDLNSNQPINISIRRSTDGGKSWTNPVNSFTWPWEGDGERWAASDPSFVVDRKAKKIFLFYNVWHVSAGDGIYRFYVQESKDNGKKWSKPRDITKDIAFPEWPFGKPGNKGGFIFISSGSGIQLNDEAGTLLHTLVHVGDGNALFGSDDHGKTWKAFGKPVKNGDECKVVELSDGRWMINSRDYYRGKGRLIHITADKGMTWTSTYDKILLDPGCNAQIMRYGKKALLFTNCKAENRSNLFLRTSIDDGATWSKGIPIYRGGAAYSDLTALPKGGVGILYEGEGYGTIDFVIVPKEDLVADAKKAATEPDELKK